MVTARWRSRAGGRGTALRLRVESQRQPVQIIPQGNKVISEGETVGTVPRQVFVNKIDELLGPAEERFFGSGFRRVCHVVGPSRPLDAGWKRVEATAEIRYPADWSTKAGGSRQPHLSTLDGMLLAALLSARVAKAQAVADGRDVPWLTLKALTIRAGNQPSQELGQVPVSVESLDQEPTVDAISFAAKVAGMKAKVIMASSDGDEDDPAADRAMPGVDGIGAGYRGNAHCISNVCLQADRVTADVGVSRQGRAISPGLLDAVIALAQVSQALLYQLDDIERSKSETLWMRHVDATVTRPAVLSPRSAWAASAAIEKATRLRLGPQDWRVTQMNASMAGIDFRYSLAHRLS